MGGISSSDDQNSNADLNKCGGFRQRDNRAEATADFRALRDFENITMYRGGQSYGSSVNYLRNIVEKYRGTISAKQFHQYLKQILLLLLQVQIMDWCMTIL